MEILADAGAAATRCAEWIARAAREAVAARGRFVMALSGGATPLPMFDALAAQSVPWHAVDLFQVDERVVAASDERRNLRELRARLTSKVPLDDAHLHPMPVELASGDGASQYAMALRAVAGEPPILDLIHLGLGADGHTASLVPGDPVLEVADADIAVTRLYAGTRRMTLTVPAISRARTLVWLAAGRDKREPLRRLRAGDRSIPAGLISRHNAVIFTDVEAAASGAGSSRQAADRDDPSTEAEHP